MNCNVLGINIAKKPTGELVYDGSVCFLNENGVIAALAEERVNRNKYSGGFENSLAYIASKCNLTISDIDLVVTSCYGEEPRLDIFNNLDLTKFNQTVMIPSHHLSHAYSAFVPSELSESLIIVVDNEGTILGKRKYSETWRNSMERLSVYHGRKNKISLLEYDMDLENMVSLGEMYSIITKFIGFKSYQNSGKTMALAAFGDATRFKDVPLVKCLPNGRLLCPINNNYLETNLELVRYLKRFGHNIEPRSTGMELNIEQVYKDLAATMQDQLEKGLIHKIKYWKKKTGINNVCIAGGVALNCMANYKIAKELDIEHIFIPSNPGDQGLALGNALYGWQIVLGKKNFPQINEPYFGINYSQQDVLNALLKFADKLKWRRSIDFIEESASFLFNSKIVAWFQGKSEWGPRALGARSILADPRNIEMKTIINEKIKHREDFQPFAPVTIEEKVHEYFVTNYNSPFMNLIAPVRSEKAGLIPAVLHIDNTARFQTVTGISNPSLHRLISIFGEITGIYVLLNTSFNDRDEPIVETPEDALTYFVNSNIDYLVFEHIIVERR